MPAFKSSVHWSHIKMSLNNFSPIGTESVGPTIDYESPHDRNRFVS